MKLIILAGGYGTRLSEETSNKPKPMVEIGGKPILWHIMKHYYHFGIKDFIICLGYKGYIIKEYFSNYFLHQSDFTIDFNNNETILLNKKTEDWKVSLIDTGIDTMTGGRLKRVKKFVKDDKSFCFTYGDGLSDLNIIDLINFHNKNNKLATLTSVIPPARFGALKTNDVSVVDFQEKPTSMNSLINGGFFVLSPKVIDYIENDKTVWEQEPLKNLAKENNLNHFIHNGFWRPMDTLRDKIYLDELWNSNKAPWKLWK